MNGRFYLFNPAGEPPKGCTGLPRDWRYVPKWDENTRCMGPDREPFCDMPSPHDCWFFAASVVDSGVCEVAR